MLPKITTYIGILKTACAKVKKNCWQPKNSSDSRSVENNNNAGNLVLFQVCEGRWVHPSLSVGTVKILQAIAYVVLSDLH